MMKKILFIDDEEDILEAVKIILERENIRVECLTDLDSVDQVVKINPDLILLDLLLIGRSGSEVCGQIKADQRICNIPVLIISAYTLSKLKKLTRHCQAQGYIQKPFEMSELVEKIKNYLRFSSD